MAKSQLNSRVRAPWGRLAGAPVFLYHGVSQGAERIPAAERKYWISKEQLSAQLRVIRSERFTPRLLSSLWNSAGEPPSALPNSVVLTFDDGNLSDYRLAFPLLQQFACPADFFVNPGNIGQPGFLSWEQIAEMHRAGMSFQSHGWDHINLADLSAQHLARQLRDSRRELQDRLGAPVEFLSVPYGLLHRRLVYAALEVGYRAVCCSRSLPARPGRARINRVAIYAHTGAGQFARLLWGNPLSYAGRMTRAGLIYFPKQILLFFRPETLTIGKAGVGA